MYYIIWISVYSTKYVWELFKVVCLHLHIVITCIAWIKMKSYSNFFCILVTAVHCKNRNWTCKSVYCCLFVFYFVFSISFLGFRFVKRYFYFWKLVSKADRGFKFSFLRDLFIPENYIRQQGRSEDTSLEVLTNSLCKFFHLQLCDFKFLFSEKLYLAQAEEKMMTCSRYDKVFRYHTLFIKDTEIRKIRL